MDYEFPHPICKAHQGRYAVDYAPQDHDNGSHALTSQSHREGAGFRTATVDNETLSLGVF